MSNHTQELVQTASADLITSIDQLRAVLPAISDNMAAGMEQIAARTGKTPLMTRDVLKMARKKMFFSSAKARRELGYAPRPAAMAVRDALSWFRKEGMLK